LKTADQLLKKNPNHGETEAMKALTMNAQGNSEEGEGLLSRIEAVACANLAVLFSVRTWEDRFAA
jgi:hypothetical protein